MKKFIRLLLSFLSVLLFFSCSNNLKSSSLVISFNLQNQKNQNLQRAATYSENSYVTVIMYDVENMEDQIEDIPDFKIIQKQTVPVKNNSARITFNDITVGTKSIIKAQITCLGEILYEGQSQIFVVSEGKNTITINLNDPQEPKDLSYDADNGVLEIYTEEGLKKFRDIVHGALEEDINVSGKVYQKRKAYPNVNAKLCNDIELSENWEPIGNSDHFYQGIFDGKGKCVTNLTINSNTSTKLGFFGCVQDATIMNLYVEGNIEATNDSDGAVGGIVGYAKSLDESVTISNCINNVQINSQSKYVGGILGDFYLGSGEIKIDSCVNIANLIAQYPSGILNTSGKSTITNCLNLGKLTSTSTSPNYSAGICMTYSVDCNVSYCINAGSIISDEQCYPILCYSHNTDGRNPTCINCFYDSDKIQNVPETSLGSRIPSLELDTLPLDDGWYNGEVSDFQYPIPTAIKDTFENKSSCWGIIFEYAKIPEATVPGAYFVNGDGDDGNDGFSIDFPKKNLTNVITSLKDSPDNHTRTIYIDGKLTAASQGVTTQKSGNEGALVYIMEGEGCQDDYKITIKGINNALLDAENFAKFFASNGDLYLRIEDVELINGKTTKSGGAFFFYGSILELDNCKISNCSTIYTSSPESLTGIYMCGTSVLEMTNTTCKNSIYLYATTATIGSNCTIGTTNLEATDGFITLDSSSTLKLDGENIFINKPIYVKHRDSSIKIGDDYYPGEPITIKLSSSITDGYDNSDPYTLVSNCDESKSNYFTIECEDPETTATLGVTGKITVSN